MDWLSGMEESRVFVWAEYGSDFFQVYEVISSLYVLKLGFMYFSCKNAHLGLFNEKRLSTKKKFRSLRLLIDLINIFVPLHFKI